MSADKEYTSISIVPLYRCYIDHYLTDWQQPAPLPVPETFVLVEQSK